MHSHLSLFIRSSTLHFHSHSLSFTLIHYTFNLIHTYFIRTQIHYIHICVIICVFPTRVLSAITLLKFTLLIFNYIHSRIMLIFMLFVFYHLFYDNIVYLCDISKILFFAVLIMAVSTHIPIFIFYFLEVTLIFLFLIIRILWTQR